MRQIKRAAAVASATAVVLLVTAGAVAAESDARPPLWTAVYLGAHVGVIGGSIDRTDRFGTTEMSDSALQGGLYVGANYQAGRVVYGIEGDIGWINADDVADTASYSIRGRLGYTFDRLMIFATAGLALREQSLNWISSATRQVTHVSETMSGLAIGAGVEYRMRDHVAMRGEVIHFDHGSHEFVSPSGSTRVEIESSDLVGRLGVSFLLK